MKTITGNLIDLAKAGNFDVIVHGCNCFHLKGAGIAKAIKDAFPNAYEADTKTVYGAEGKLGMCSYGYYKNLVIVNAYTQFYPGKDIRYTALQSAFQQVKRDFSGKRIAYPKIGAGIAGGDWGIISRIIDKELESEDNTLVVL